MMLARYTWLVAAWVVVLGLAPAPAHAARSWTEGTTRPFSAATHKDTEVADVDDAAGVRLSRQILWEYARPGTDFEPFHAEVLGNGNVLVTSRTNEVLELTRGGRVVWSYTRLRDNPALVNAYASQRLPSGNTLITDRRADFIIEVTPDKRVVWRYGVTPDTHSAGNLVDPFFAQRLPNGNTLITDNRGGNRVIEVRSSDYDPDAPNLGYTEASIVWQYGQGGTAGLGPGLLVSPRHAVRLPNGNTLITDSGDRDAEANRLIEVTSSGQTVWSFGVPGEKGRDDTRLDRPSAAQRLPNGNTLVVEEDGGRMLEITPAGAIVDRYGAGVTNPEGGEVAKLRGVQRTATGTLLVDQGHSRLIEYGVRSGGTFVSAPLTLGMPGVKKVIHSIKLKADKPAKTAVSLSYSLDGGPWKGSGSSITLPKDTAATTIRYRITLTTKDAAATPVAREVTVAFDVVPRGKPPTGSDTPATKKPKSTTKTGSSGSGGGTGGGSGTGTGSGTGSSTGAGTGVGAQGAGTGGEVVTSSAAPGSAELVDGVAGDSPQLTRGTLLSPVGGGGSGGDESESTPRTGGTRGGGGGSLLILGAAYFAGAGGRYVRSALRAVAGRVGPTIERGA